MTFQRALTRWLVFARMGKAGTTQHFYKETVKALRRHWREALRWPVSDLTEDEILRLAMRIAHYSPSRWNSMLQCLRWITPAARALKRRALNLTREPPPTQAEFAALVAEAERLPRSRAALVIQFLAFTGLRITAARRVRWGDVYQDRIEYISKGGRRCAVPIVPGCGACWIVSAPPETLAVSSCRASRRGWALPKPVRRQASANCRTMTSGTCSSRDALKAAWTCRRYPAGLGIVTAARFWRSVTFTCWTIIRGRWRKRPASFRSVGDGTDFAGIPAI